MIWKKREVVGFLQEANGSPAAHGNRFTSAFRIPGTGNSLSFLSIPETGESQHTLGFLVAEGSQRHARGSRESGMSTRPDTGFPVPGGCRRAALRLLPAPVAHHSLCSLSSRRPPLPLHGSTELAPFPAHRAPFIPAGQPPLSSASPQKAPLSLPSPKSPPKGSPGPTQPLSFPQRPPCPSPPQAPGPAILPPSPSRPPPPAASAPSACPGGARSRRGGDPSPAAAPGAAAGRGAWREGGGQGINGAFHGSQPQLPPRGGREPGGSGQGSAGPRQPLARGRGAPAPLKPRSGHPRAAGGVGGGVAPNPAGHRHLKALTTRPAEPGRFDTIKCWFVCKITLLFLVVAVYGLYAELYRL